MKIKVIYKKLGRERAWGQADLGEGVVELDPRLKGRKHLNVCIHEVLHIQNPEWSETEVINKANELASVLWREHYRRVDNSTKI